MRVRLLLAAACAVAGVAVLAGPGWALLAAALLLTVGVPSPRWTTLQDRITATAGRMWRWLTTGRQAVAAAAMPLAVLGFGVGLAVAVGVGWGVAAASVAVGGLSLAANQAE